MGGKTCVLQKAFPSNMIYGFDFSNEGISFAKKNYSNEKLIFVCDDAHNIKNYAGNRNVELVSAFELLEHIEDWESVLDSFCQISDRYVLLSTPCGRMRDYEKNIGHWRNFKKGQIEAFMNERGYRVVRTLYAGFPFWSPITRDLTNLHSKINMRKSENKNNSDLVVTCNPLVHGAAYFIYRYLCFDNLGDQFIGLFEKIK